MKFLRRKFIRRVTAWTILLVLMQSIVLPPSAMALTTGPSMPEYTSYESPGATDMVNLLTGDFNLSLPILEVPGPEGSFSVPITYNAGIGLDQEASWVGLGWNINVGSITRSINAYPDDANGESQTVLVQDLDIDHGWSTNIGIGTFGHDSESGRFGSFSLGGIVNYNYTRDQTSVGVAGLNVGNKGFSVNGAQFAMAVISLATAAIPVPGVSYLEGLANNLISGGVNQLLTNPSMPNALNGYWQVSKETHKKNFFTTKYQYFLDQTRVEDMYGTMYLGNAPTTSYSPSFGSTHTSLTMSIGGISQSIQEFAPSTTTANRGAASDISYANDLDPSVTFENTDNPVIIAPDNFVVNAAGVGGAISPQRLDIGSVSMPREMTESHARLAPIKYLPNDTFSVSSYKVPFQYKAAPNGSYLHLLGAASGTAVTSPDFYFGISAPVTGAPTLTTLNVNLDDIIFQNERIAGAIPSSKKIPQGNVVEWLSNDEIKNGITYDCKFIDFLSAGPGPSASTTSDRYEFRRKPKGRYLSTTGSSTSFSYSAIPFDPDFHGDLSAAVIDLTLSVSASNSDFNAGITSNIYQFSNLTVTSVNNTNHTFSVSDVTQNGQTLSDVNGNFVNAGISVVQSDSPNGVGNPGAIGGLSVTRTDGMTYHFALPVHDYNMHTEVRDISNPTSKRQVVDRGDHYANAWVLTAITGPDFIDVNQNGLVDDSDWGYWVKFNYGFQTSLYTWRMPYAANGYRTEFDDQHESYSQGNKELIYLNSIETRSHVALFMKSARLDGKSAGSDNTNPLKLDEIALLQKEVYRDLISVDGIPEFSNKLSSLCLSSSFTSGSSARTRVNLNCLKRIILDNNDYSLCPGTTNSSSGKLTLTGITIKGRDDLSMIPGYKFQYGNNQTYNINKWDAWGYFCSTADATGATHAPSQSNADLDGSAWSLTKVFTPIGSEIDVTYERDTYSSVSGNRISTSREFIGSGPVFSPTGWKQTIQASNSDLLFVTGDTVQIGGSVRFECPTNSTSSWDGVVPMATISSSTTSTITLYQDIVMSAPCTAESMNINFSKYDMTVAKSFLAVKGDGLRVASITTKDQLNNQRKIRYLYNIAGSTRSSGAISQLPDYVASGASNAAATPGYPQTPVLYATVTVLNGKLTSDSDFDTKEVYQFEVPDASMYTAVRTPIQNQTLIGSGLFFTKLTVYENTITDRTSKLGNLKSLKIYDVTGTLTSSQTLTYTDAPVNDGVNNYQGIFTDGTLMFDALDFDQGMAYYKINRTSMIRYPYMLKNVSTSKDGFTSETTNLSWDFLTGAVTQKLDKSSLGVYIKTVSVPAYTVSQYAAMGSKTTSASNRNMLTQNAATYTYKSDVTGASQTSLIGATAQTWNSGWANYRNFDGGADPNSSISSANPVWRTGSSYVWSGAYARLQADGTDSFSPTDEFDFSGGSNPGWQYAGEPTLFNHYGAMLESKDLNGIYSSKKMGYADKTAIASASNASYSEVAFSSAEDAISGQNYFGGEVAVKSTDVTSDATVVKKSAGADSHTGDCAVSISTGYGFVYKTTGLSSNKMYRASAWTNSSSGKLYYKLNGGSEVTSTTTPLAGKSGWFQINMDIPVGGTFTSFEVGVKGVGSAVLYDDFRFQPSDAQMSCNVGNPLDYQFTTPGAYSTTWVLDNNNLYTKYEVSSDGLIKRVSSESVKFAGEHLMKVTTQDYSRFHVNK